MEEWKLTQNCYFWLSTDEEWWLVEDKKANIWSQNWGFFEVKLFEQTCIWGLKWSQWEIYFGMRGVRSVRICTILHTFVLFRYDRFVFRQYVLLIWEERAVTIIYLVLASDHHMSILFRPHHSMFDWIRHKRMHY